MSDETPLPAAGDTDGPARKLRLGGMALRNGLLVHGPTHWAAAVRDDAGAIQVASGRKPKIKLPVEKVPGARGVVKLAEAMAVIPLVKRALPATKLPFQNASVLGAVAGTTGVAAVLRRSLGGTAGGEAAVAAVSLLPSLVALRSANLAGTVLLRRLVDKPRPVHGAALQLASLGAAVEVFAWSERNAGTPVAKALQRPGHELQRVLGTREPTEAQLEVGRAALAEILRVEEAPTPA